MLEKQYSVQFFTSLVESMQKVCREYLQFDQTVELSGYLSLEIDNTKRERYVVSEMLQNTGNVISESYCTKAFKTVPSVAKKSDSSREVLGELNERLHDQAYLTSGSDARNSHSYSRQMSGRSGHDGSSFSNHHHARTNSFPHTDVSQSHQEPFSYLPADWDSMSVHGAGLATAVSHVPSSHSNHCDRLAPPPVKRRTMQVLPTIEPKKGRLSSGDLHTEILSPCEGHPEGLSTVFSNSQHSNEHPTSVFSSSSDSQSSLHSTLPNTLPNTLHNTLPNTLPGICHIKTERDSSVNFVQVDDLDDSNGLPDASVSEEQFRTLTMGDSKLTHESLQLQNTQLNPGIWEAGDANHKVELFKKSVKGFSIPFQTKTQVPSIHQKSFARHNSQNPFYPKLQMFQFHKNQPQCINCGMMFLSEAGLMFHKCRNSMDSIKCPTCSKTFYNRQSMKRHQAVHSPLKPYSCQICHAKFSSKTAMTQHIKYRHQNPTPMTISCVYDDNTVSNKVQNMTPMTNSFVYDDNTTVNKLQNMTTITESVYNDNAALNKVQNTIAITNSYDDNTAVNKGQNTTAMTNSFVYDDNTTVNKLQNMTAITESVYNDSAALNKVQNTMAITNIYDDNTAMNKGQNTTAITNSYDDKTSMNKGQNTTAIINSCVYDDNTAVNKVQSE